MKKIILSGLLVGGFVTANAQQREKGTIEIIPQIGFSISDYSGKDTSHNSSTEVSSINVGVAGDYYFNDRWSLRSGLLFQTMGSDIADIQELRYFTVPLNANYHFGSSRKWNVNFGPSVGFLASAKYGGVGNKDDFNTTQIGLNIGIGYKFEITKRFGILVDYQAMAGLTNATKDFTIRNNYGSLNVGAVLKL